MSPRNCFLSAICAMPFRFSSFFLPNDPITAYTGRNLAAKVERSVTGETTLSQAPVANQHRASNSEGRRFDSCPRYSRLGWPLVSRLAVNFIFQDGLSGEMN